jgi:hypothetical protein
MREAKPHRIFAHELRDKNDTYFNQFLPTVKEDIEAYTILLAVGVGVSQIMLMVEGQCHLPLPNLDDDGGQMPLGKVGSCRYHSGCGCGCDD